MNGPSTQLTGAEVEKRRVEIQRSLSRINTAAGVIVIIVIALAITAFLAAWRAGRSAHQAQAATVRAEEELWKSYLAQARAGRLSGIMGSKQAGLDAIRAAARIRPDARLRNEYLAHLALLDYDSERSTIESTPDAAEATTSAFDASLERRATVMRDGWVRVQRVSNGEQLASWRGSTLGAGNLAFSADGTLLAAQFYDRVMRVFRVEDGHMVFELPDVVVFGFDQSGSRLAAQTRDQLVHVIEPLSAREICRLPAKGNRWMCRFSPDGATLALSASRGVELWDIDTGKLKETLDHEIEITSIAWRKELIAAGDALGEVRVWNTRTHRSRRFQGHQGLVSSVILHPQGDLLASTSYDGTTRFWDPYTGHLLLTTSQAFARQFSGDGTRLAYWTHTGWGIWRENPGVGYRTVHCSEDPELNVWHVDFSPDSKWFAATKATGVEFFRLPDGKPSGSQKMELARCSYFLPDGQSLLMSSARTIGTWRVESKGESTNTTLRLAAFTPIDVGQFDWLEPGTMSWDRRRYVLPLTYTEAAVVNLEKPVPPLRLTNAILPKLSALSSNGRWVATGTFHGEGTRIWDAITGHPIQDLHEGNSSAYFSPDDRFLVSAGASAYRIYQPGTWTMVREISTDSGTQLPQLAAFETDGRVFAMVKEMNRVELVEPGTWHLATALIPPDPRVVTWLAFSPDSRWLAVATVQDLIELWDLKVIHQELAALGLDWENTMTPGISIGGLRDTVTATSITSVYGSWAVMGGVLVALGCAWFVRYRQHRLLSAYMELDRLAEDRSRDLQVARAEILHSQKMKALGTLAAGIAHDFNNLLSVIRMSNKLIAREARESPAVQESAAEIDHAVEQGKLVVRSMLGYSREPSDSTGPFSVPGLVEDTVALLSKQFLSGITLTLELDRNASEVNGSPGRLEQMLLNLVVNAAEAMSGNGKLLIAVRQLADASGPWVLAPRPASHYVELVVRDSGPGIDADVLPRIFEPFFTTKNIGAAHGTGLGLSMVYNIARQDGLGIAVETAPGNGAAFKIAIPVESGTTD
ncbi:MAG TPA: ATP-binding protein [Candidatus Nitrosotalea sp.]|nr:ATP-binding protein [Candidatus Nitrosotalea sp.]